MREYDASMVENKILLATANYNLAADPTSCAGGRSHEMYPILKLPALSIRIGDMIKFTSMTGFENIGYGELIAPEYDDLRAAEMALAPTEGCFSTLRCTFAQGNEPEIVPISVPGGMPVKLVPAKCEREKPDAIKPEQLTPGQIADIRDGNEPRIKEMIQ